MRVSTLVLGAASAGAQLIPLADQLAPPFQLLPPIGQLSDAPISKRAPASDCTYTETVLKRPTFSGIHRTKTVYASEPTTITQTDTTTIVVDCHGCAHVTQATKTLFHDHGPVVHVQATVTVTPTGPVTTTVTETEFACTERN